MSKKKKKKKKAATKISDHAEKKEKKKKSYKSCNPRVGRYASMNGSFRKKKKN